MGCECEIYGKQVVAAGSSGTTYTLPAGRRGSAAILVVDVLELNSSGPLEAKLEHKNSEDTNWTSAGSTGAINATAVVTKHITGLKELYRIAYTLGAGSGAGDSFRVKTEVVWLPH